MSDHRECVTRVAAATTTALILWLTLWGAAATTASECEYCSRRKRGETQALPGPALCGSNHL
jgi:hypothetical protein